MLANSESFENNSNENVQDVTLKKVRDLQDPKYSLVQNDTDIKEILDMVGVKDEFDTWGCLLVAAGDGEYDEVWGIESNIPYLHYTAERLYPPEKTYESTVTEIYEKMNDDEVIDTFMNKNPKKAENADLLYKTLTEPHNWQKLTKGNERSYLASTLVGGPTLFRANMMNLPMDEKLKISFPYPFTNSPHSHETDWNNVDWKKLFTDIKYKFSTEIDKKMNRVSESVGGTLETAVCTKCGQNNSLKDTHFWNEKHGEAAGKVVNWVSYQPYCAGCMPTAQKSKVAIVAKENVDSGTNAPNYSELSKLDAEVERIRELNPKDKMDAIWISHGKKYEVNIGYPASMGERGYNLVLTYESIPSIKQLWDDIIEQYKAEIRDSEYQPGKMGNLDAYEEKAYKRMKQILSKFKIKTESLHAIGDMVHMGGFDNADNPSDVEVKRCDKCFELTSVLHPCKCNDKITNLCHECWEKNGMPPVIKEGNQGWRAQLEQDLQKNGFDNYKVEGEDGYGVTISVTLNDEYTAFITIESGNMHYELQRDWDLESNQVDSFHSSSFYDLFIKEVIERMKSIGLNERTIKEITMDSVDVIQEVQKMIEIFKAKLITKAKKSGLWENFGQDEVRKVKSYLEKLTVSYVSEAWKIGMKKIDEFDNWCQNFDLSQLNERTFAGPTIKEISYSPEFTSVYNQIKATGCDIAHHESDLYCPVTPETTDIVKNYQFKGNVRKFTNRIDGTPWYEIPFAYDPFWQKMDAKHTTANENKTNRNTLISERIGKEAIYKTVDLRTVKGIEQAEKLKEEGWQINSSGIDTIQFYKVIRDDENDAGPITDKERMSESVSDDDDDEEKVCAKCGNTFKGSPGTTYWDKLAMKQKYVCVPCRNKKIVNQAKKDIDPLFGVKKPNIKKEQFADPGNAVLHFEGNEYEITITKYQDGNNNAVIATQIDSNLDPDNWEGDNEYILSVNIPNTKPTNERCFWLKNYSENEKIAFHFMREFRLMPTGQQVNSGFVTIKEYEIPQIYYDTFKRELNESKRINESFGGKIYTQDSPEVQQVIRKLEQQFHIPNRSGAYSEVSVYDEDDRWLYIHVVYGIQDDVDDDKSHATLKMDKRTLNLVEDEKEWLERKNRSGHSAVYKENTQQGAEWAIRQARSLKDNKQISANDCQKFEEFLGKGRDWDETKYNCSIGMPLSSGVERLLRGASISPSASIPLTQILLDTVLK